MSADVASLDVGLAQECFRKVLSLQEKTKWIYWQIDDKEPARDREERQRKTKKRQRRRKSGQLLTMALACLGLGCAPVPSKGTVCKMSMFLKIFYFITCLVCSIY